MLPGMTVIRMLPFHILREHDNLQKKLQYTPKNCHEITRVRPCYISGSSLVIVCDSQHINSVFYL